MEIYVSTCGNDRWSGRLPEPNTAGTDGPLATIARARDVVRELRGAGRLPAWRTVHPLADFPITVYVRGGRYHISEPIVFAPQDSAPVTYAAYRDEKPIIDGGAPITGWRVQKKSDGQFWVADIPEVADGRWYFRQLFVNGERRQRARLPKEGFYQIQEMLHTDSEDTTIRISPGEMEEWKDLGDVELVALHVWIEERMPLVSFDASANTVELSRPRRNMWESLVGGLQEARYYVENVYEALTEPGEWFLDRTTGTLYYIPMPGEEPESVEVFAPAARQLLRLDGQPDEGEYVEFLRFQGLTFQHTDWEYPAFVANQAAHNVPGAIAMKGARYCSLEECTIEHVGGYGVELLDGCLADAVVGCEIRDTGAGAVKLNGSDAEGPRLRRTGNNKITDNHLHGGGRVFHSAVGILSMHSFGNDISHNDIHDFYYTGISCGWIWGYEDNVSKDNRIEKNHIHHIGHGRFVMNDMGGIYLLGVQPGTVVRGNLIHDVAKHTYGGWGIYPDEGSSHMLIENNITYETQTPGFFQHYGRENIVRNNIFAFGREGQVGLGRADEHNAFTFTRNIVVAESEGLFLDDYAAPLDPPNFISDFNLFWNVAGKEFVSGKQERNESGEEIFISRITMARWKELGQDRNSMIAAPRFRDLENHDFTLMEDSPAFALGFKPIDMSDVGPRPKADRK